MENGDGGKTCEPKVVPKTQQLCRFFSQGRRCYFGAKCKYLHTRGDSRYVQKEAITTPNQADVTSLPPVGLEGDGDVLTAKPKASSGAGRHACRYFLSGHCTMEDRCRFWHPSQFPKVGDQAESTEQIGFMQRRAPAPRPNVLQEVKLCELTKDVGAQLRETEIKQLKRRFPKDRLIIQERSDGKFMYYRATVEATDPDWVNIDFSPPVTLRGMRTSTIESGGLLFNFVLTVACTTHLQPAEDLLIQSKLVCMIN